MVQKNSQQASGCVDARAFGAVALNIFYLAPDNSPLWAICQFVTKEDGSVVILLLATL